MAIGIRNVTTWGRRWHAAITAAALLVVAVQARGAQDVGVDAQLQGNALAISTHATIRALLPIIWQTLTDYDHLAESNPTSITRRPSRSTCSAEIYGAWPALTASKPSSAPVSNSCCAGRGSSSPIFPCRCLLPLPDCARPLQTSSPAWSGRSNAEDRPRLVAEQSDTSPWTDWFGPCSPS